jgi:hypothetical protein
MECEHAVAPCAELKWRETAPTAPGFEQPFAGLQRTAGNLAIQRSAQASAGLNNALGLPPSVAGEPVPAPEVPQFVQQDSQASLVQGQDMGAAIGGNASVLGTSATGGGPAGAAGGSACSIPGHCPPVFCTPLPGGKLLAGLSRDSLAPILLAGIAAKVNPRVVPLWSQYLFGGAPTQDLSPSFGADFTNSVTTAATTDFLADEVRKGIESTPPSVPAPGTGSVILDVPTLIPSAIAAIGTPGDPHEMNFDAIGEIPGNIAGGIGKDQTTCPVGALPSPFDDDRTANGSAQVTQNPDGSMDVVLAMNCLMHDTIDLCPGDCGAPVEQLATVPMSRFEASGVSGDVPFTVNFPAPPRTFTARPATPPTPPAPTPPAPTPTASTYTVQSGDTLSAIAAHVYGDPNLWPKIYQTNKAVIGPDPNLIFPGQVLTVSP